MTRRGGARPTPTLWHFTCAHGAARIGPRGTLHPVPHPMLDPLGPIVWFTTDPDPARADVGLTSVTLPCDRLQYRYRVDRPRAAVRWVDVRHRCDPEAVATLEATGRPGSWWLTTVPTVAVIAPR